MNNPSPFFMVTDIGTGKIVVLVAAKPPPGSRAPVCILGKGEVATDGLRKGCVVDSEQVTNALHNAISEAERSAGVRRIGATYVSLTGHDLVGERFVGTRLVRGKDRRVSPADVVAVYGIATQQESVPPGYFVAARLRQPVFLDGNLYQNPIGRRGVSLKASHWVVAAPSERCELIRQMLSGFGVGVNRFCVSSVVLGQFLASPQERAAGVLVVDVGAGVTDYILYHRDYPVGTGALPIGGDHIDEDFCEAFDLKSHGVARRLKQQHRPDVLRENPSALVSVPAGADVLDFGADARARQVSVYSVEQIIRARYMDIFGRIRSRLGDACHPERLGAGVVLTGGLANLQGIENAVSQIFQTEARRATFPDWVPGNLRLHEYSAALGMVHHLHACFLRAPIPPRPGLLRRVLKIFGV